MPSMFCCHSEISGAGGVAGALSICSDASCEMSIMVCPSSATIISLCSSSTISLIMLPEITTGMPIRVGGDCCIVGNAKMSVAVRRTASVMAMPGGMSQAGRRKGMLFGGLVMATMAAASALVTPVTVLSAAAWSVAALVIEAGFRVG